MCRNYPALILLATLPCLGLSVYAWGSRLLLLLAASMIPALIVEILFSHFRKSPFRGGSIVFSVLLVLLLPSTTPVWLVSLAAAFGIFFGQEIFGGTGYHLVSPTLLAMLFLMTGYLQEIQGPCFASAFEAPDPRIWMIAGGLMLLPLILQLILQPSNLPLLAGIAAGTILAVLWMKSLDIMPYDSLLKTLVLDAFAFVICFIAFDPACTPRSLWARVIYGFIIAALAFVIGTFSDRYSCGIIIALLFGNLISPLLDLLFKKTGKHPANHLQRT